MSGKTGYIITTRRLRLRCKHPQWLYLTQEFYNQVEKFYYHLFLKHRELWERNGQEILRSLEILSLPGKEEKVPEEPLPWEEVPPYFRRAAANTAIAAAKSHISRDAQFRASQAIELNSAVVYYSRMYRDFSSEEITLKVWDGGQWRWMRCRLYGEAFPDGAQILSPSIVLNSEFIMLHVPIKQSVLNTDPVKKRMREGKRICGLQFTNGDAFAVASIYDGNDRETAVRFFGGGKQYAHHCRRLVEKIEKSRQSLGKIDQAQPNRKYWIHLKNLSEHYAHQVSRGIIEFCQEYGADVIALPKYNDEYTRRVMFGSGDWSPLHLSIRIRKYLQYKGWKAGIPVIEVHAAGTGSVCARCGAKIERPESAPEEFICEAGHRGNRYLNSARNLALKCRKQFEKN